MKLCVTSRVFTSSGIGTCVTNKIGLAGLPACSVLDNSTQQAVINKLTARSNLIAISVSLKATAFRQFKMKGIAFTANGISGDGGHPKICAITLTAQGITLRQCVLITYK